MRLSIIIACINQLEATRECWGHLVNNTTGDYELVVIDNGSTDGTPEFLDQCVKQRAPRFRYIRNPENIGVWAALQQGYGESAGEVLIFLHNDVCIYEQGWNERVKGYFEARPDLGVAGFHGSKGCDLPGQPALRWDSFSNMTDAERHGARLTVDFMPVAVVDGFCLTCRRVMLDATGGFDQGYLFHHFYDYDVCITSLKLGYKNIVVNVPCHHLGSVTAHSLDYHHWVNNQVGSGLGDIETFERNAARLREKHRDYLPVYVEEDFSIRRPGAA